MKIASETFKLKDGGEGFKGEVIVVVEQANPHDFTIRPAGYGDAATEDGFGCPVVLELYEGRLRLLVWADINKQDPTHIIDLEDARESNREEE